MTPDLILFLILALVSIGAALGMLLSKSAVYSALFLVLNFLTIAIFYVLLQAPFLAMAQITVYAGAIMVLFLFVIMLLGPRSIEGSQQIAWQRPVAFSMGLVLLGEIAYILFGRCESCGPFTTLGADFGSPERIGDMLFNRYLIPFEITSVLLLVGMIGVIVLSRKKEN
ncbi:MAG: NADH-quinone oxidoreductase subunit J [Anaerolineales bacterium]